LLLSRWKEVGVGVVEGEGGEEGVPAGAEGDFRADGVEREVGVP
jgi:hypothetical protein